LFRIFIWVSLDNWWNDWEIGYFFVFVAISNVDV